MNTLLDKVWSLLEPQVEMMGYELVDVRQVTEFGRGTLRIAIDKEGGVTVGDCERVAREMGTLLDVELDLRNRFFIEVSSPGVERRLVREKDYIRFMGRLITIKTKNPIDGRSNYKGILKNLVDGKITIEVDRKDYEVPFELVERTQLVDVPLDKSKK